MNEGTENDSLETSEDLYSLVQAIAQRRAAVYVGAGVSVTSGLKTWSQLLAHLAEPAAKLVQNAEDREYLRSTITENKNLEAADIIHELLGSDLEQILWDLYACHGHPSEVHLQLARIPFSLAITTNFDRLLEEAYGGPTVLTWRDPDALLRAVQLNRFVLLKTHGAIGNGPSVILTGAHYQDLMHANPNFRQVMKVILETKVCLFIGASLTDPDLVHLLQEISSDFSGLGHHYAFLPVDQAAPLRREILYNNLRVRVIPMKPYPADGANESGPTSAMGGDQQFKKSGLTIALSRKLRDLSGEVALERMRNAITPMPTSDEPDFFLKGALEKLLKQATEIIGVFRGDVCLSSRPPGDRVDSSLIYAVHCGPTDPILKNAHSDDFRIRKVEEKSVCGIAYYKAKSEGFYVPDVTTGAISPLTPLRLYGEINYKAANPDVRSELAVPIEADGLRIGVLNLESRLIDAFSRAHIEVAVRFAEKAGRLYTALEREESSWPASQASSSQRILRSFGASIQPALEPGA